MKNFSRFAVFSPQILREVCNFLSLCIDEQIPILQAKQYLDDFFDTRCTVIEKAARVLLMSTSRGVRSKLRP